MKAYYDDGAVQIFHGDCLDVLPICSDVVISDPPYGTGERLRVDGQFVDSRQDWDEWNCAWLDDISTPFAVFCPPARLMDVLGKASRLLVWVSSNPVARKGVSPRYGLQPIVARGPFPETYGLDWFHYRSNIQTPEHPHEKPLAVMAWLVGVVSRHGDVVLDPFMGSGSTLVAAKRMGRRGVGIEREERYCDIAARRLAQGSLFVAGAESETERPRSGGLFSDGSL